MGIHSIAEFFKYRRRAKTRHGIHSPFVYDFIEKVLRDKRKYTFKEKLTAYFSGHNIMFYDNKLPAAWHKLISPNIIIVIKGIHKTKENTIAWDTISADLRVKLSLDLFGYGLIFFKEEFKVKQHFILKYPTRS